jgi:hypothetical protein
LNHRNSPEGYPTNFLKTKIIQLVGERVFSRLHVPEGCGVALFLDLILGDEELVLDVFEEVVFFIFGSDGLQGCARKMR